MTSDSPPLPSTGPNSRPWPPMLYAVTLLGAALLEYIFPGTPALPESLTVRWLGFAMFLAGLGLAVAGARHFNEMETTIDPTGVATVIAVNGPYAYTRNPMYLGALVGCFGLGLGLRSTYLLIAVPLLAVALTKLAIEREEAWLATHFGRTYLDYKARVRRWL